MMKSLAEDAIKGRSGQNVQSVYVCNKKRDRRYGGKNANIHYRLYGNASQRTGIIYL